MERLILKLKLSQLEHLVTINEILVEGFNKTGNKFRVEINGSKGYMSHIEIACEGTQKERNNIIWANDLFTEKGRIANKTVSIYHSNKNGVRVELVEV